MATGHLVTHTDLALLGNIDLGQLHDARGQLVAHRDVALLAAQLGLHALALVQVVHDRSTNHVVDVAIGGPLAQVHRLKVLNGSKQFGREHLTLGNQFGIHEVLHTSRLAILGQHIQFLEQLLTQVGLHGCILLFEFSNLRVTATCALLHGACIELRTHNHALERRVGLE